MTIDEAIENKKKLIHEWTNELSLTPNNDITHLRKCQDMISYYNQEIEWLEELKSINEMDLEIPQHFTKEQSKWIKAYCIKRNKEFALAMKSKLKDLHKVKEEKFYER